MSAVREQVRMPIDGARSQRIEELSRQGRSVKRQPRLKLFNRISFGVCCVVSFAAVWMVAAEGANIDKLSYQNAGIKTQIQKQTAVNASLTADVAKAKNPSQILSEAMKDGAKPSSPITLPTPGTTGK